MPNHEQLDAMIAERKTMTGPQGSVAEREFVITRDFDAPAHLLFLAYSKPEHLLQWFGPGEYPLALAEVDFREGGTWRFAMSHKGQVMPAFGGEYLRIIPNELIAYSNGFEGPDREEMVITISFTETAPGKTTLRIHTLFGSIAMKQQHLGMGYETGVGVGCDQLAAYIQRMPSA